MDRSQEPFSILWPIYTSFSVRCELDMLLFPFDSHHCFVAVSLLSSGMQAVRLLPTSFEPYTTSTKKGAKNSEFGFEDNQCVSTLTMIMIYGLTNPLVTRCKNVISFFHDRYSLYNW